MQNELHIGGNMESAYFIVLTCNPAEAILTPALAEAAGAAIGGRVQMLAPHIACEIPCDEPQKLSAVQELLNEQKVDVNLVPAETRRKKLLVADMESTIIAQECLDELADLLDLRPQITAITARAMQGALDFEPALRERVGLLKGLPESALQKIYDERVTLMGGAEILVKTMQKHGAICGLVSGGFSFYAEKIATHLGFDRQQSNILNITNGQLDGTVAEPILGRNAKAAFLTQWAKELKITPAQSLAVGDGANDLDMLAQAGFGVAFRAKPAVCKAAKLSITHGDLTSLLYLQGYRQEEFACP